MLRNSLTRWRRAGDNSERRLTRTLVLAWLAALDLGSYRSGQTGLTVNQLGNLRRFESSTAHLRRTHSGLLLACAFGPSSSVVERNLGKIEVTGSIPVSGSWRSLRGVLAAARSPANVTPIAVGFCCVWRSGARMETVSVPRPLSSASRSGASCSVESKESKVKRRVCRYGEAEVCTEQAACKRGDDRAHRPRQDDVDRGHHQGAGAGEARQLYGV